MFIMENSCSFTFFVFLGFISIALSQNHADTTGQVSCYKCHGANSGTESFPQCMSLTPVTCPGGQGCRMVYATDWHQQPTIGCSSYSPIFDKVPSKTCPYGGIQTALRQCDLRCFNDSCVNSMVTRSMGQAPVTCPGRCSVSDPQNCMNNAKICSKDQFCQLDVQSRTITGSCRDRATSKSQCLINLFTRRCPPNLLSDPFLLSTAQCHIDCCTNNNCVAQYFGANNGVLSGTTPSTTKLPTTATTTMVKTTAATPYNVYNQLVGECRDHLEPGVCNDLRATQDLCKSNGTGLHLDLCPDTCGVCQAIKEANCHDTVLDGECAKLVAEKDICNGDLARYTCAATCGLCDILVEEKLVAILAAGPTTETTTRATTKPTTVLTTQPTTMTTEAPTTQPPRTTESTMQPSSVTTEPTTESTAQPPTTTKTITTMSTTRHPTTVSTTQP